MIALVPIVYLILIILRQNTVLIDRMHVPSGGLCTVAGWLMCLVTGRILPKMGIKSRVKFIGRMVPYMMLLMPTLVRLQ